MALPVISLEPTKFKNAPRDDLTFDFVKSILSYCPETGEFVWLERIHPPSWNFQMAGRAAGCKRKRYWLISINHKKYFAHRLAWLMITQAWPVNEIDHANGDKLDNSAKNLRQATSSENKRNRGAQRNNVSGLKGVRQRHDTKKWSATIMVDGNNIHLGDFLSASDAHAAYCQAAANLHREFANTSSHAKE